MKLILINIILASCLLLIVESLDYLPRQTVESLRYFPRQGVESVDYFPRQVNQRDELPYQPFIPLFRGYSSKDRFYQAVRNYPENSEYNEFSEYQGHPERPEYEGRPERPEYTGGRPEYSEYSEHHKKGSYSGTKSVVKEAVEFCSHVMKRLKKLKESLMGCDEVEIPKGKKCSLDQKCYVVSEYYDTTPNRMYEAYQRACPCPQKHFSPGLLNLNDSDNRHDLLVCLGQINILVKNAVVLSVLPNSNSCTYVANNLVGPGTTYVSSPVTCMPSVNRKFLFVCEVPC